MWAWPVSQCVADLYSRPPTDSATIEVHGQSKGMGCTHESRAAVIVDISVDRQPVELYSRVCYMCIQIGSSTVDLLYKSCHYEDQKGCQLIYWTFTTMTTYKSSSCNRQQFSCLCMSYSWSSCSPHDIVNSNGSCQAALATALQIISSSLLQKEQCQALARISLPLHQPCDLWLESPTN